MTTRELERLEDVISDKLYEESDWMIDSEDEERLAVSVDSAIDIITSYLAKYVKVDL